jgi:hypothetical protein
MARSTSRCRRGRTGAISNATITVNAADRPNREEMNESVTATSAA